MKTREEQREERRRYEADVDYEVWRMGGNMDQVNRERVEEHYYAGYSIDDAARAEMRRIRPAQKPPEFDSEFEENENA